MSDLYNVINGERIESKVLKQDISRGIGKILTNANVWRNIKTGMIRFNLVAMICVFLDLEMVIVNPRKSRNSEHNILQNSLEFYRCINIERLDFGYSNGDVAKLIGAPSSRGKMWNNIISMKLKYNQVVKICDELGLELIIRNPRKKISHLLNTPKIEKS